MSTSLNSASKSSKGMEMARDTMSKETDFHDQLLAQGLMVATPVMNPWRHRAGNFSNIVISLKRARSRVVLTLANGPRAPEGRHRTKPNYKQGWISSMHHPLS